MSLSNTLSAAAIFATVSATGALAQDAAPDEAPDYKDYESWCERGLADDANALEYLKCFHAVSRTTWEAIVELEDRNRLDPALTNEETLANDDCRRVYANTDILEAYIVTELRIKNDEFLDENLAQVSADELFVPLPALLYRAGRCAAGVVERVEDFSPSPEIREQIDILQDVADFGARFPRPRYY